MLKPDQVKAAMSAVRDQVLAICKGHEEADHGGDPCLKNRASVVAYLAHCLGVRDGIWDYAEALLSEYDRRCEGTDCVHGE